MPTTEPCPHCDGTGQRLVPPDPQQHGGQQPDGGRAHGYEATYQAGCRCQLCKAGHREYRRHRRALAEAGRR